MMTIIQQEIIDMTGNELFLGMVLAAFATFIGTVGGAWIFVNLDRRTGAGN